MDFHKFIMEFQFSTLWKWIVENELKSVNYSLNVISCTQLVTMHGKTYANDFPLLHGIPFTTRL